MMKGNELLLWMSARREGSWHQFRGAVAELHSPQDDSEPNDIAQLDSDDFRLHQRYRFYFDGLGHAEFFAHECESGWRITPPTLAAHTLPNGYRAVLCGARSPALVESLLGAGEQLSVEIIHVKTIPNVVRVTAREVKDLESLAAKAGVHFQYDAPLAILSHLPPCDPPSWLQPQSEFPDGADWRIRIFDPRELAWRISNREDAQNRRTGLFEFQLYDRWEYFLRRRGKTFKLPRAVATYVLLRRRRALLRYNRKSCKLSLPGICRPPRLLERALVLCSGIPATFDQTTSRLTYSDVPQGIAQFAADLLRKPLA